MANKVANIEKEREMKKLVQNNNEFVVLDIETTGYSPFKGGRIIEIGAVKVVDGVITDVFSHLINPEQKIPAKITELTGINDDMVKDKAVYRLVLPLLYKFIGNSVVVCHNLDFDWDRFLNYYFKTVGIKPLNKTVDTLLLSKTLIPGLKKYKLGALSEYLGITLDGAHRAVNDAEATALVLLKLKQDYLKFETVSSGVAEQVSMFDFIPKEVPDTKIPSPALDYRIRRVAKWQKNNMNRLYVTLTVGVVYFDIPSKSWGVNRLDDIEQIDLSEVRIRVLEHLGLKTEDELCTY